MFYDISDLKTKEICLQLEKTCDPTNAASSRTCELAGGNFIERTDIPEDNEMYAEGKREVFIYRFDIKKS